MPVRIYRIAVVIPKYGLTGGAEGFVAELTERIAANPRYEVHVFANRWIKNPERLNFHHVPIISFPKFLTAPSFAYFTSRKIAKTDFDIVHAHERIFTADVFTMHGVPHRYWINYVRKKKRLSLYDRATAWVERKLVLEGNCSRFLAVSGLAKDKFMQEYPIDSHLVEIVNPGVAAVFPDREERKKHRRKIREEFGINPEVPLILFVSMNFEIKGLDRVIAGLCELKRSRPNAEFNLLVVGKGSQKSYRRIAMDCGIADKVFFASEIPRERMREVYNAGDLLVMLSKFDTFGLVVLEAMAASLPVVISGNVGAKDVVREGINGFVIEDTSDVKKIAEKIALLLDKKVREKMGEKALRTARENAWDAVADRVTKVYEKILQNNFNSKMK